MGSMHSLLNHLVAAGSLYGWRIDALLLGSLVWAATTSYSHLRFAIR
jgi:hypothetical protein